MVSYTNASTFGEFVKISDTRRVELCTIDTCELYLIVMKSLARPIINSIPLQLTSSKNNARLMTHVIRAPQYISINFFRSADTRSAAGVYERNPNAVRSPTDLTRGIKRAKTHRDRFTATTSFTVAL